MVCRTTSGPRAVICPTKRRWPGRGKAEAVIRLWDDADHLAEQRRRALAEARRRAPEAVEPMDARFFNGLFAP